VEPDAPAGTITSVAIRSVATGSHVAVSLSDPCDDLLGGDEEEEHLGLRIRLHR
jgi:hypothetical protein